MKLWASSQSEPQHMKRTEYPTSLPAEGFARLPTVEAVTGCRHSWIYAQIRRGSFPKPIKQGRSSFWKVKELRAWLEQPGGWSSNRDAA